MSRLPETVTVYYAPAPLRRTAGPWCVTAVYDDATVATSRHATRGDADDAADALAGARR